MWVDPMLEELTASLIVSQHAGAPAPRCLTTPATASQEEDLLLDTHSPATVAQWMMELPLLWHVQGLPQVMPPWVGQPEVAKVEAPTEDAED